MPARLKLVARIRAKFDDVERARHAFNEAISSYNEVVEEANGFRDDIANEIRSYIDERSESWQASDRAMDYDEWQSQWSEELEWMEIILVDESDAATALEELPDAP